LNILHLLAVSIDHHKPRPYYTLGDNQYFWSKGGDDKLQQYFKVDNHSVFELNSSVRIPIPEKFQKILVFLEEFL